MEDNSKADPPIAQPDIVNPVPPVPVPKIKLPNFFRGLSRSKSLVAAILSILILTGAVGTGVYLVQQRQSIKTEAGSVVLSLSPNNSAPNVGDIFTVAVAIDTKGLSASAADLKVRYETAKLEAQSIKALGDFLPVTLVPGTIDLTDTASGRASIVLGAKIDQNGAYPKSGTGVLAQVTFKAKSGGQTTISFGGATAVAAVGQDTNVVGTMNPVTVNVTGPAPSFSPSPSGSPTPSPSKKPGDINADGKVNIVDVGILIDNYGKSPLTNPKADVNGDGKVNIVDVGILIDNYGK